MDISNLLWNYALLILLISILDISSWGKINITNIYNLFYNCISLNSFKNESKPELRVNSGLSSEDYSICFRIYQFGILLKLLVWKKSFIIEAH